MVSAAAVIVCVIGGIASGAVLWRRHANTGRRGSAQEEMLREVAAALMKTGDDFLPSVVQAIAAAIDAELTLIGELGSDGRVQTIAVHRGGAPAANFTCALAAAPAAALAGTREFCCPDGAQQVFAGDPQPGAAAARGCAGVALVGTAGDPIGVLIAATRHPLDGPGHVLPLLRMLAGRVAAEMQRARTERELRRREEHLLQVQRVEAIGRLAGGVAHDFNNLLMIMIGYAEILRDRDGPSQEITELLAAANRATTLTRQLLAFGRRQVLQTQRLDMNAVVTQVQTMLAPVIGVQVRLTTSLDPDLPPVDADPGQMEQVLVNLALNARDAMPDGGTLLLETRTERVDQPYYQMPPGTYVCLAVSDTGVGMSPAVQAHIFEPFYTTKGSSGTGLGLSSVYGIVKQSGGFIWCRSEPGCGTTFTIYLLPARGDAPRTAAQDGQEPAATGAERLLVVDDEPGVRALMTRLLAARGYEVHAAEDGPSALAFLTGAAAGVDLVITDIVMPDMSGIRLAEEIESHWPGTPVLFVSGYAQNATHGPRRLAARGPVLNKPFTPTQIATAVREILDSAPPAAQRNS